MNEDEHAFERLHALVRKGYRPELGVDGNNRSIRLTHIAKTPDLLLHEDGVLEEVTDRIPRYKRHLPAVSAIGASGDADRVSFLRFVETVPKPTLWDRTRRWRTKWVYGPLFLAVLWGVSLLITAILVDGF